MQFNMGIRGVVAALAAPAFIACASTRQNDAMSAAGTLDLPDYAASLSTSEMGMLQRMTDPNILGHMAMADSIEAVMAQFAERRTKNDDVLEFARMMDVDHSNHLNADRALGVSSGVGIHTLAIELKASHMGQMVDSIGPQISELKFDRNYILAQIQMHEHMLGELEVMQDVAQNDMVRDHVKATIPVVAAHLERARAIAKKYEFGHKPLR
jgi:predicted outer membrane protein